MSDQFEQVNCAICHRNDTEVLIRGKGAAQIVKCRHDGLVYVNPRPKASEIREAHKQFVRHDNLQLFDRYRRNMLRREAEVVKSIKAGGSLLDIGCATGTFFENFDSGQWRRYGVDTSYVGVEIARRKYRAEVFCGTLAEAGFPKASFDVVSMLDALYYSPDPASELLEIRRILKDDGLLVLEIPGVHVQPLPESRAGLLGA